MLNTLWTLLTSFLQIGLFSIGGGYATIPLIEEQVVTLHQWLSSQEFLDIITISQMTPGPLAVNTSTFVGLRIAGLWGAVVATVGCVSSGITISLLLYRFFTRHRDSARIFSILCGLRSASTGLIASAAVSLVLLALQPAAGIDAAALIAFALSMAALRKLRWNPILLIFLTGVLGLWICR